MRSAAALAASALAIVTSTAHGQDAPGVSSAVLEEVVVTVRRRGETAADVPLSVTSLPAGGLERAGIEGLLELAQAVPGLVVSRFGPLTQPALRGVTARLGENSVATYVDGFYVPNSVGVDADFNHVERVDVLKGPQGTLFGRNATGGAILITTADPSRESALRLGVGAETVDGQRDGRTFDLYGSAAIAPAAAVNVAVSHRETNGWIYDVAGAGPINSQERQNVRAKLVLEPSAALRVSLAGERGTLDDPTTTGGSSWYRHRLFPAVVPPDPALPAPATPNVVAVSKPPRSTADWKAGYAKLEWSSHTLAFAALTSYRTDVSFLDADFDGSAAVNPPAPGGTNLAWRLGQDVWQQELTLGSAGTGRREWLVGLYLLDDEVEQLLLPGNVVGPQREGLTTQETTAASVFADFTYEVSEAFELTAGARYSREKRDARYQAAVPPAASAGGTDFDDFTPRFALRYTLSPAASLYASASEGFKSGFVNASAGGVSTVAPETLRAYEVGYKARRGTLALDLAAYTYDWRNLHVARFEPTAGGNIVQNAARARIRGAEAEVVWVRGPALELRAAVAHTDGAYTDFPAATVTVSAAPDDPLAPNGLLPQTQDWSGNPTIRTPEWTMSFGWAYARRAGAGELVLTGNVYRASEFAPSSAREHPSTGRADLTTGPYALLNMALTWRSPRGLSVSLYGRNLTDERYLLNHDANAFGDYRVFGEPRVLGVRFVLERE